MSESPVLCASPVTPPPAVFNPIVGSQRSGEYPVSQSSTTGAVLGPSNFGDWSLSPIICMSDRGGKKTQLSTFGDIDEISILSAVKDLFKDEYSFMETVMKSMVASCEHIIEESRLFQESFSPNMVFSSVPDEVVWSPVLSCRSKSFSGFLPDEQVCQIPAVLYRSKSFSGFLPEDQVDPVQEVAVNNRPGPEANSRLERLIG